MAQQRIVWVKCFYDKLQHTHTNRYRAIHVFVSQGIEP